MAIEELEQVHTQLIQEEQIKTSELPENIRKKIKGWNLLYGRLKNNPDDEKMFNSVQRQSINLADLIQDWLEKELEEEEQEETKEVKQESKEPKESKEEGQTSSTGETPSETKPNTAKAKANFGNLVMEKKILAILKDNNGRIPISELQKIIGKKPTYPTQVVNNIKLQKIFLVSAYRKI